jgi:proteasome accessory factor B
VSRKSERLVNLTIALLATKRYLTKAEIFRTVAGYTGDSEAKDRMFERDKEDLRSLGITIELGTFDPLFEDEAGYRIKAENYQLQLKGLDPLSIALLSQAGKLWREAALGSAAQSGLRKLRSIGINSDLDSIVEITTSSYSAPEQLPELIEAITSRRVITFEYLDQELVSHVRRIEPYRLSNSRGYWYLVGRDCDKAAFRTFRLDRFNSSINISGKTDAFEIDLESLDTVDSNFGEEPQVAVLHVRKGKSPSLRNEAVISELDSEWDQVTIQYQSQAQLIREVLWAGENAILISPHDLREQLIDSLKKVVASHV